MILEFPEFALRKGRNCGNTCKKFHAPVDLDLDSVLADVWNRAWMTFKGKRVSAEEAELFQVQLRITSICYNMIHWLSGDRGLFVEPRSDDGKMPDQATIVLWIENAGLEEVQHKQKTTDKTLPVTRFGNRYGVRVFKRDADTVQAKLGITDREPHITVQQIYEMRPFPHGTQKKAVQGLLHKWDWPAKAIQPGRADGAGMSCQRRHPQA